MSSESIFSTSVTFLELKQKKNNKKDVDVAH